MRIRRARLDEYDEIADLDRELLEVKWHDFDLDDHWVAVEGGRILAYGSARPSTYFPGWSFLSRSGVVPEARGKGIQKRLIRVRARDAKCCGLTGVYTYTIDNPASGNSLIACGFKLFDPGIDLGPDVLWWAKRFYP